MTITKQKNWDKLSNHNASVTNASNGFTKITIDFSQYTIIALFDKLRGSGGHLLEIAILSNLENTLISSTPVAPKGNATSAMTPSYHSLKIAKRDGLIVFKINK